MKWTLILVSATLFFSGCDHIRGARVEQTIEQADFLNGASLVLRDQTTLYEHASGQASPTTPNRMETRFYLASLTKLFVRSAVLRLIDDGQLEWDAPVSKYMPGFQPQIAGSITIGELFENTSGLPRELDEDPAESYVQLDSLGFVGAFLNAIPALEMVAHPDSGSYNYSNVGYWVLGGAIEETFGETLSASLERLIFEPLGMEDSGIENPSARVAWSWIEGPNGELTRSEVNVRGRYASGGGYSSAKDLARFAQAMETPGYLSRSSWNRMMGVHEEGDIPSLDAGGVLPGQTNRLIYLPMDGVLVILLNNVSINPPDRLNELATRLVENAGGELPKAKSRRVFTSLASGWPEGELSEHMQRFTDAIASEDASRVEQTFRSMILAGEFTEDELSELGPNMASLPVRLGGFDVAAYQNPQPLEFSVFVRGTEEREVIFTFIALPEAPTKVKDLRIMTFGPIE